MMLSMEIDQGKIRTVVILGAPRSGTTLLYDLLCTSNNVAALGCESHKYFDELSVLERRQKMYSSGRYFAPLLNSSVYRFLKGRRFIRRILLDCYKYFAVPANDSSVFVEKTPRNVYRLNEVYMTFPNAKFIVIRRGYSNNYQSILRGWFTKENFILAFFKGSKYRFTGATKDISLKFSEFGKPRRPAFGLPLGWEHHTKSLKTLVAYQLSESCRLLDEHMKNYQERTIHVNFEQLISSPASEIERINAFCETQIPQVSQLKRINK